MAIIIGDIHSDIQKVEAFLAYKPEAEHVVLGDMTDPVKPGITLKDELACLHRLFSSRSVLLWGNHDLAYSLWSPWRCSTGHPLPCDDEIKAYLAKSEYLQEKHRKWGDVFVRDILSELISTLQDRMKAAHAVDGWLCTHAGVGREIAALIPVEVIVNGSIEIAGWLNEEFEREISIPVPQTCDGRPQRYGYGPLFNVDYCRGGTAAFGGIFWHDTRRVTDISPLVGRQIFGHTPAGPHPLVNTHWVNLNATENGVWVFDTSENRVVDL